MPIAKFKKYDPKKNEWTFEVSINHPLPIDPSSFTVTDSQGHSVPKGFLSSTLEVGDTVVFKSDKVPEYLVEKISDGKATAGREGANVVIVGVPLSDLKKIS